MFPDLDRDGYIVLPSFLDESETRSLLQVFEANASPVHRQPFGASILSDDLAFRAAVDRGIGAVLRDKLESLLSGYRYCFGNFLSKGPNAPHGEVPLHQDIVFVDEARYQSIGTWCPLMDVDETNGCLVVVPGSHLFNTGPRAPGTPFPYRDLLPQLRQRMRAVPMKAGDALLFYQRLFHSSPPNLGPNPRVAAGGLCVPRDAQLYCYYADDLQSPRQMEVFEVDDLFYTRYIYGKRPEGVQRIGVVDYWHAPLTAQQLTGVTSNTFE